MSQDQREFSLDDVEVRSGSSGPEIWVAHEGKVYDVSGSRLWKGGTHMRRHRAGADLTVEIKGAPHGPEVLDRMPLVGTLKARKDPMDDRIPEPLLRLLEKIPMLRRHPHPMTVHFPLAFCMTVPLFNILFLMAGEACFEKTAYYMLTLSVLGTVVAVTTGPYTWWLNYGAIMNSHIRIKLIVSAILFLLLLAGLLWRSANPGLLDAPGASRLVYLLLTCTYPPLVSLLGWIGAKMTFPH